jgi:DNA gyrase/topoisomerase IV subunit A
MYLYFLCSLFLFGCGNGKVAKNEPIKTELKATDTFMPDTTINSKFILENYQSVENYFTTNSNFKLVEQLRSSPVAIFSNKGKKEYLLAYQYEGGTKNAFSCFEIGKLDELQNVAKVNVAQIDVDNFNTESSLQLGQSIEDVKKIKGNSFTETTEANEKIINYKIEDSQSGFLKRYNMPSYFLRITFDKTEKVKRIIFGFDYP